MHRVVPAKGRLVVLVVRLDFLLTWWRGLALLWTLLVSLQEFAYEWTFMSRPRGFILWGCLPLGRSPHAAGGCCYTLLFTNCSYQQHFHLYSTTQALVEGEGISLEQIMVELKEVMFS
jgi:hypothetical protein